MNEEARVISPDDTNEDLAADISLRPRTMDEFIGQPVMREKLGIFLEAAKRRNEALDHTLIFGPPGLGKNDPGPRHCPRNGSEPAPDLRPGAGTGG